MKPIIIIDDDADVREIMTFALETDGHKVIPYQNGKEALDKLSRTMDTELPCLIIVDYLMPEMDGATFIKNLQEKFPDSYAKVPIALASAMGALEPVVPPSETIIHLPKPMDLDELLKLARRHCPVE